MRSQEISCLKSKKQFHFFLGQITLLSNHLSLNTIRENDHPLSQHNSSSVGPPRNATETKPDILIQNWMVEIDASRWRA